MLAAEPRRSLQQVLRLDREPAGAVDEVARGQVRARIRAGDMRHALVLTALAELFDLTGLRAGDPAEAHP